MSAQIGCHPETLQEKTNELLPPSGPAHFWGLSVFDSPPDQTAGKPYGYFEVSAKDGPWEFFSEIRIYLHHSVNGSWALKLWPGQPQKKGVPWNVHLLCLLGRCSNNRGRSNTLGRTFDADF